MGEGEGVRRCLLEEERRRSKWWKQLENDMEVARISPQRWKELAKDRAEWRRLTSRRRRAETRATRDRSFGRILDVVTEELEEVKQDDFSPPTPFINRPTKDNQFTTGFVVAISNTTNTDFTTERENSKPKGSIDTDHQFFIVLQQQQPPPLLLIVIVIVIILLLVSSILLKNSQLCS